MQQYDNLEISNPEYQSVIGVVRKCANDILSAPLHLHFTDHSIEHSERILEKINLLIPDSSFLNDSEKFVLTCAVLLHDIGMQTPKYAESNNTELNETQKLELIRDKHHEFSEQMIIDSLKVDSSKRYYLGLDSKREYADAIALIAKGHRKSVEIKSLDDLPIGSIKIRQKLLVSLIRLGDCLDIDYRRVKIDRLNVLPIPVENKFFWFCHHYVRGLNIDRLKILIVFVFPQEYETMPFLKDSIIDYIEREIINHIEQVYPFLYDHDIPLYKDVEKNVQYSQVSITEMPNDLIEFITSKHNVKTDLISLESPDPELIIEIPNKETFEEGTSNMVTSISEKEYTNLIAENQRLKKELNEIKALLSLYHDVGIVSCTETLSNTVLIPKTCMKGVNSCLWFMGVGGEKWVTSKELRDYFVQMLRKVQASQGEVRFLLINPSSSSYNELYELRGESVPSMSFGEFEKLNKEFPCLKVKLYDHLPTFRMQFVDRQYVAISRYAFDKEQHEKREGGWKSPHLIINAEKTDFQGYTLHSGSLYESFSQLYDYIWKHSSELETWVAKGRVFNLGSIQNG